jgi:hypothetical protein
LGAAPGLVPPGLRELLQGRPEDAPRGVLGVAEVVRQGQVVPAGRPLDQVHERLGVVAPQGPQVAEVLDAEGVDIGVGGVQSDEAQHVRRRGEDAVLEPDHHAPVPLGLVLAGQVEHEESVPRPPAAGDAGRRRVRRTGATPGAGAAAVGLTEPEPWPASCTVRRAHGGAPVVGGVGDARAAVREELAALLRTTRQLEQDAEALGRAITTELERERRRIRALVLGVWYDAWRWN